MAFDYINEAFKKLALLEESTFKNSIDGINQLSAFMDEDDETIRVIDPEAETEEDLKDSYIGKIIINCNICHSHIFENKEDIVIDEEGNVNSEKPCPYCGEQEGFTIVGEIAPFNSEKPTEEPAEESTEETSEEPEDAILEEGLGAAIGLGLAAGAARAVGDKVTSSILGDDINNDSEEELLTEEPKMSAASRRCLKEEADIDTLIDSVGGVDNVRDILETTANEHPGVEADSEELSNVSYNFVEDCLTYSEWESVVEYVYDSVFGNDFLTEDFKEVSIKTDDQKLEMTSDENGKVTVTTEPITSEDTMGEETIAPISAETQEEIINNNDSSIEDDIENTDDMENLEFDFDDIDEEGMDELGESYLRKIYENVKSFKTSSVGATETSLIVEGVITFDSGAKKKTGFIFEAKDANNKGQVRFVGSNKQLSEAANAFTLVGKVDNKKLFVESLKYNYVVNNNTVRGVVRRK